MTAYAEMLYTAAGEPMGEKTIIEGFNLEVASGGYFGCDRGIDQFGLGFRG